MSNVIFGDTSILDFGEFLPSPYIEKIEITDGSNDETNFEISYSLFFLIEEEDFEQSIDDVLSKLKIFLISYNDANSAKMDRFKNDNNFLIDILRDNIGGHPAERLGIEVLELDVDSARDRLDDGYYINDLYDSLGRRIAKITVSYTLSERTNVANDSEFNIAMCTGLLTQDQIKSFSDLTNIFMIKNFSDLSHEKILDDGAIADPYMVAYTEYNNRDTTYPFAPLRTTTGEYHKTDTINKDLIREKVNVLLDSYRLSAENDEDVQNSIDSISYALAVFYENEELIPQLNLARRTFVDKSNVTPTGRLYSDFTTLLVNLNDQLQKSPQLKKDLIINNKIIDLRVIPSSDEDRGFGEIEIDDIVPKDLLLVGRDSLRGAVAEEPDNFKNHGFFFINLKNLIDSESNIASVFNMQKLYSITPTSQLNNLRKLLYNNFYIKRLEFKKYSGSSTTTRGAEAKDDIDPKNKQYKEEQKLTKQIIEYTKDSATKEITNTKKIIPNNGLIKANIYGNIVQTYISQRNFSLINGDSLDDHSLVCFEFQDVDLGTPYIDWPTSAFHYSIGIEVRDETKQIVEALITKYDDMRQPLKDYVKLAQQICSYNNIDDRFNNFFVKQINLKYQNGLLKPWLTAATIYNLWRYLSTDRFSSIDEARDDARKIVTFISPETGTLDQLTTFAEDFESFFETSLSNNSNIQNLLEGMADAITRTYLQEIEVLLEFGKPLFEAEEAEEAATKEASQARDELDEASSYMGTGFAEYEWGGQVAPPASGLLSVISAKLPASELEIIDFGGTIMDWLDSAMPELQSSDGLWISGVAALTESWYIEQTANGLKSTGRKEPDPLRVGDIRYKVQVRYEGKQFLGAPQYSLMVQRSVAKK